MTVSANSPNPLRPPDPTHILVFSASLRAGSLNTRLARLAARTLTRQHVPSGLRRSHGNWTFWIPALMWSGISAQRC